MREELKKKVHMFHVTL